MEWINIQEASALSQKPERTLRYLLAKDKINGKKSGKSWLIEVVSLDKAGSLSKVVIASQTNSQQSTVNSQQSTVNSQQKIINLLEI
jgi:hypothetical protein